MHNMFLETCKQIFELWLANGLLNIEELQHRTQVPAGVGRLPARIKSRYDGFTAQQWILLYSVVAMKHMLPSDHMGCWLLYVNACKLLCKPMLKKRILLQLMDFCL